MLSYKNLSFLPLIPEESESGYSSTCSLSISGASSSDFSLPDLNDNSTITELDLFLAYAEKLISRLEIYGSVYSNSSQLNSHFLSYEDLNVRVHLAQALAFNMKSITHIKKCCALILQIEESKLEWLVNCPNHLFLSLTKKTQLDVSVDIENSYEVDSLEENVIPTNLIQNSHELHDDIAKVDSLDSAISCRNTVSNSIPKAQDQFSFSVDISSCSGHIENIISTDNPTLDNERKKVDIVDKILNDEMYSLSKLLIATSSKDLPHSYLVYLHNSHVPVVDRQISSLQHSLRDYINVEFHDVKLALSVAEVIKDAINWTVDIRHLFLSKELFKKSQGQKLYGNLSKFSTDPNIDIYRFFHEFEALTIDFDYSNERAEFLFSKYLVKIHQEEVTRYRHDYEAIKSYMILKYGDPKPILMNLIQRLHEINLPDSHSNPAVSVTYYRKFQAVLETINSYLDSTSEFVKDFEMCIFSHEFLLKLLQLMPLDAKKKFFKQMDMIKEDSIHVKGRIAFNVLLDTVRFQFKIHDRLSKHDCFASKYSNCDEESCISYHKRIKSANISKQPTTGEKSFPCVISGHNHSVSQCSKFLNLTTQERVKQRKNFIYKHCAVCLQSSLSCHGGKCINIKSVPKILLCKGCKSMNKINPERPCYSVLFCLTNSHGKPPDSKILKGLEIYIPGFKPSVGQRVFMEKSQGSR